MIGDVIVVVVATACAGCGAGPPLCFVAVTALLEVGLFPSCWSKSPKGQVWSALLPLSTCSAPKKMADEANEVSVVIVNLCTTCADVHSST